MINKSEVLIFSLSFLIGFIFTILFLGLSNIGLENTDWFTSYDLKSDLLAFKFFLNEICRFHFLLLMFLKRGFLENCY